MKLAKREKLFIGAAAGIIGIILILNLLVIPFFKNKNHMARETETLEKLIKDMDRAGIAGQDMAEISGGLERALAKRKEPSLLSFINKEAKAAGIGQDEMTKTNPSKGKEKDGYIEDFCSLELELITLPQLADFLFRIEKPEQFIFINNIKISKDKKEEGYLNANIRVMSYEKVN